MLFPTIRFAVFFVVVWAALLASRKHRGWWQAALLMGNWAFYAAWDVRFTVLLAASIAANHGFARLIARWPDRRSPFVAGIVANVALLATWKYFDFFSIALAGALRRIGLDVDTPVLDLVLPLGISFFTFQAISYLVEVRWLLVQPASLADEAVWLSFFPTVVSGPITRASEFFPQLATARLQAIPHEEAFLLIVRGLFKKVVIASYLGTAIVDDVFAMPERYASLDVIVAVYAFGAQLYCDFSGYTDIARGVALLLGIRLPENFNAPYAATSINKFWTRWHMTLSHWLRDFLFMPLGKRAAGHRWATYASLLAVMLVAGLWHGAAWTFVAFGAVHGGALAVERWWRDERRIHHIKPRHGPGWNVAAWLATFHVVSLGWLFFRAESLGNAFDLLGCVSTACERPVLADGSVIAVIAAVGAVQLRPSALTVTWAQGVRAYARLRPAVQVMTLVGTLVVIDVLGPSGLPPFIYFGF